MSDFFVVIREREIVKQGRIFAPGIRNISSMVHYGANLANSFLCRNMIRPATMPPSSSSSAS
jgi:hypothetical protein